MKQYKSYTAQFKFKVAVEMLKGDKTIAEIINKYQVPASVANRWKKQLIDGGIEIFKKGSKVTDITATQDIEKLHSAIGRLKVENDFLQQASAKLKL